MMSDVNATNLGPVRRSGQLIGRLLDMLYPAPPSPDIVTLEDVKNRYRLTGFSAPAITALQQARRIIRAGKDYCQIGLCEFHIGLIYMHWGHCLAAAQQFVEARRQWLLVDEMASVCLTYFAEGQALYYALHYEPAMTACHKVELYLSRLNKLTLLSADLEEFMSLVKRELLQTQEDLRERMWPPDSNAMEPTESVSPPTPTPTPTPVAPPPPTASSPPPDISEPIVMETAVPEAAEEPVVYTTPVPPPRYNIVTEELTPIVSTADFASQPRVPLPFIHATLDEPASLLLPIQEYFKWYRVIARQGTNLPFIRKDTWLLVDTQERERYEMSDLILIGGDNEEMEGNIEVEPYITPPVYKRIFLRRIPREVAFTRDSLGRIRFEPQPMTFIIGVVLGFWSHPRQAMLSNGQSL